MSERRSRARQRIINITVDEGSVLRRTPEAEHERRVAIFDLVETNHFAPVGLDAGPYCLRLVIQENRLVIHIHDANARPLDKVVLPISPFRRLIKDYFTVCNSYYEAIKRATPSQIEAIDVGRRSLHNEGSELLRNILADKIEIDFDTARRLFTLLSVLSVRA